MTANNDKIESMLGACIVSIAAIPSLYGDDKLIFTDASGQKFTFYHERDCCESVTIEDICGDLNDLLNSPILQAEEVSSYEGPVRQDEDSYSWTFYKFATAKGSVTVRWFGTSNGYYSEHVDFKIEPGPSAEMNQA